jgi:PIN domain nuclease of toxin-antitoxin system
MKLLVDTHLLLWWLEGDKALSRVAREMIADPENTVFISAATHWEIRIKASLGKLQIPEDFAASLDGDEFEDLPFTAAHAKRVGELPWHHRDPFDRALVAQAEVEGLTLLTSDEVVGKYGSWVRVV